MECNLEKLGYRSFNYDDLCKLVNKLENLNLSVEPKTNVRISVLAHYLQIVGKNIFPLYDNKNDNIDRQAHCSIIYLSMVLDELKLVFDEIETTLRNSKSVVGKT